MTIELAAETIAKVGPLPITNSLILTWATTVVLALFAFLSTRKISLIPSGIQNCAEIVIEAGYNSIEELAHSKTKSIFPLVMTFFLFIITANWMGLLPGVGTIGIYRGEHLVPLLRAATSDLNTTLSLALISAIATHIIAIRSIGIGEYLSKWVSLNPIFLFVGVLELISEFTKIASLSFRLFGNIFAGEVVLTTVSGLFAFVAPLPFYGLEILAGFVQATVFTVLTTVFIVLLSQKAHH